MLMQVRGDKRKLMLKRRRVQPSDKQKPEDNRRHDRQKYGDAAGIGNPPLRKLDLPRHRRGVVRPSRRLTARTIAVAGNEITSATNTRPRHNRTMGRV